MNRVNNVKNHLLSMNPVIGESSNQQVPVNAKYQRIPIKIVFQDTSAADERYGGSGDAAILEGELLKPATNSKTVIVFMHPSGIQNLLPFPNAMARSGLHVVTCASRYPNNDTCLIMEKVIQDLGACVNHMREKFKYEKVVLAGWSGGGSLSSFYQGQAELPVSQRIQVTPAGDKVDLSSLKPADGLLILAAHSSRARIFTEWIDPCVMDESDGAVRNFELDLWDARNPNKAPFTREYIERFRKAQVDRNERITQWALAKLKQINEELEKNKDGWKQKKRDEPFIVRCTQADIRRVDNRIDPNERENTPLSDLASENHSPVGLARFTTLRSWLSQWSLSKSNADGPRWLKNVTVPICVMANGADHLVPLTHPESMYNAIQKSKFKRYLVIKGATHYYFGQYEEMNYAIGEITKFLQEANLLL